jgi:hypothetical protein
MHREIHDDRIGEDAVVRLTCTDSHAQRWVELALRRRAGAAVPELERSDGFVCQLDCADNAESDDRHEEWPSRILNGALTAFNELGITPFPLQVNRLCGRLATVDMAALSHAARVAVLALCGGSPLVLPIRGWSLQVLHAPVTSPAVEICPSAAHTVSAIGPPHIDHRGPAIPGSQIIRRLGRYRFKRAETPQEMEQVHRLNHRTFVKEIQQHADNGQCRLVDKFHEWNTYFVALLRDRVIGMLSVHDRAPFSVESRLPDPSAIRQLGMRPLEVRLLAIEKSERHGPVLVGLVYMMNCFAQANGYTHYLISAVTEQLALYRHLGFEPLGAAMGKPGAMFVPMMASLEQVHKHMQGTMLLWERRAAREAAVAEKNKA